mmetsp:Transcript_20047/g.30346  ORF Transcript_20047/g.30346 Transcript_20047/m.30346 type:complete len:254 (+) Transcript_20047:232-993(+)
MASHLYRIIFTIIFVFLLLCLTVTLGNALNLILLLDSIRVRRSTCSVDQLLSQALSHGLQVSETSLSCSSGNQVESVVYSPERRHINSLSPYYSSSSNTSGIFPGTRINNGIHNNLDGVLVGKNVNDFKGVLNNTCSHNLLSGVSSLLHEAACKTLNNGARCLTETLHLVTSSSVWKISGMISLAGNVILERNIADLNFIKTPFSEELDLGTTGITDELGLLLNFLNFLVVGSLLYNWLFYVGHGCAWSLARW